MKIECCLLMASLPISTLLFTGDGTVTMREQYYTSCERIFLFRCTDWWLCTHKVNSTLFNLKSPPVPAYVFGGFWMCRIHALHYWIHLGFFWYFLCCWISNFIAELLTIWVLFCSLLQKQREMHGANPGDFPAGTVQRILHTAILGERNPQMQMQV